MADTKSGMKVKGSDLNQGDFILHKGQEMVYHKTLGSKAFGGGNDPLTIEPDKTYNRVARTEVITGPMVVITTGSGKAVGQMRDRKSHKVYH